MLTSARTGAEIAPPLIQSLAGNEYAWREFVDGHTLASLYHRLEWKAVIQSAFGHRCHYLMVFRGNRVTGVLPLVEMKSRLFGHFFVSLPFLNSGGILTDDIESENALAEAAAKLAADSGAAHVELRQTAPLSIPWVVRTHKLALVVELTGSTEQYWASLSSRLRGKVRKAMRSGAVFSPEGPEALDDFYAVFTRNMRDLGTPVYSRRLFRKVLEHAGEDAVPFVVKWNGNPVAAALGIRAGHDLTLPWICSDYRYSSMYVNEFLYWSVLEWAYQAGLRSVDLGRSSAGSGPHRFKMQWKPIERQLYWYYWTAPGRSVPQLNPTNPKYSLAIRCWKKLPLPVANLLGPLVVRNIP